MFPRDHAATVRDSLSRNVAVDIAARIGYLVSRFFIPPFVLAHVTLGSLWTLVDRLHRRLLRGSFHHGNFQCLHQVRG